MKSFNLLMLMLFLLMPFSFALNNWYSEANAGFNDGSGTQRFTGYGLNWPNQYLNTTNSSFQTCALPASTYTPVSWDVDADNYADILITSTNTLYLYDRECTLMSTLPVGETIVAMPQVARTDTSSQLTLIVPVAHGVREYKWDTATNALIWTTSIINNATSTIVGLSCPFFSDSCLATSSATTIYRINLTDSSLTALAGANHPQFASSAIAPEGISSYNLNLGSSKYIIPICAQLPGGAQAIKCDVFDQAGTILTGWPFSTAPRPVNTISEMSAYYANLGTTQKLFIYAVTYDTVYHTYVTSNIIADITGTEQFSNHINADPNYIKQASNWAVADFNKDGRNEACFMYLSGTTNYLECFDSNINVIMNINVTAIMSINNIVIGDFLPGAPHMGFMTSEGIFYVNESDPTTVYKWTSTGRSGAVTGFPIIYIDGSDSAPITIYSDATNGFILRNMLVNALCGNDICDAQENYYVCPADCNSTLATGTGGFNTGVRTTNSSLCASNYIEYGMCALKPGNIACSAASECLSGKCTGGICENADLWDGVDNAKKQQFGNSSNTNNFIALFLMLGCAIGIIIIGHGQITSLLAAGGAFIGLAIFFAIVGWLSPWILIGIFMMLLILAIILVMLLR